MRRRNTLQYWIVAKWTCPGTHRLRTFSTSQLLHISVSRITLKLHNMTCNTTHWATSSRLRNKSLRSLRRKSTNSRVFPLKTVSSSASITRIVQVHFLRFPQGLGWRLKHRPRCNHSQSTKILERLELTSNGNRVSSMKTGRKSNSKELLSIGVDRN